MKKISFNSSVRLLNLIKYILIFAIFYVFSVAGINQKVFCFGFGMLFALVWCNQNVVICSALYLSANLLNSLSVYSAISAGSTVLILLVFYLIHLKIKKPMKPWLIGLYSLISQATTVFLQIYNGDNIIITCIGIIIGLLFMFACLNFLTAIFVRGFKYKLSWIEIVCGASILIVLGLGLFPIAPFGFEMIKFVSSFLVLFAFYSFGSNVSIAFAGLLGLGSLLATNNAVYVAPLLIWAFAVCLFKSKNRFFPILALLGCEVAIGLGLNLYYAYSYISAIPVVLGCLLFVCIPEKVFNTIGIVFETNKDKVAMKNIVNRSRESICRRLSELSQVFGEMDSVFRAMTKGGLSTDDAKNILILEIKQKVCEDCPEKHRCHRTFSQETNEVLEDLINRAFSKGKSTLLDVPPFLTARCSKLNALVSTINTLSSQYKKYTGMVGSVDTSKILIAEQLGGVSKIMRNLAGEINRSISFDFVREEKIIEELAFNNIVCSDIAIYEQNVDIVCVTLIVRDEDMIKEKIEKIVSKVCNYKLQVFNQYPSSLAGMHVVSLKTACKNDIIFGTATAKKYNSDKNGDCFSVVRIESDKLMLALCDGMGSGDKAEKTSHLAIGLVENFYKAGFDNETILSSVNKLLSLGNNETFSALDLCVIDIRKCVCDFIKLGAPYGFVKHEQSIDIVDNGALPLGIVAEMKPMIKKQVLSGGDFVIMCTDGITDAFRSQEELANFINNLETTNPQTMADNILDKAKKLSYDNPSDDMTVLVCRII